MVEIERLAQKSLGANIMGSRGRVARSSHHNNGDRLFGGPLAAEPLAKLPAIHDGHIHVEEDKAGPALAYLVQRLASIGGHTNRVAFIHQSEFQESNDTRIVIDYKDRAVVGCPLLRTLGH